MREKEKKDVMRALNLSGATDLLDSLLDDMEEHWDETEPVYECDYIRWRGIISKAYDIISDVMRGMIERRSDD